MLVYLHLQHRAAHPHPKLGPGSCPSDIHVQPNFSLPWRRWLSSSGSRLATGVTFNAWKCGLAHTWQATAVS